MTARYIGQPQNRVDGPAKVTGAAKYAAEYNVPNLLYGYVVSSTVASGKIKKIDVAAALAIPGVAKVYTHENRPGTAWLDRSYKDEVAPPGSPFRPLHDEEIVYSGQPVALVVADSFETARYAASIVQVEYKAGTHKTDLRAGRSKSYTPHPRSGVPAPAKERGKAEEKLKAAATQHRAEYVLPMEYHNPIEMFGSTVIYETDGSLTVYEKTQGVQNTQTYVAKVFGLSPDKVRVLSPYVGGAFGSGLRPEYQLFLATMAALDLKRSVRVTLTRQQMFTFGHRPATIQDISLGTSRDGNLETIIHGAIAETSTYEDNSENVVNWSGLLYRCENSKLEYKVAALNFPTPMDMRAPGAATGLWGLESAIDEMAHQAGMDPIEFRLKNYSERDQHEDKPYSSKELRECFRQGAEAFGWSKRNPQPRSMREGKNLVGWGMAAGVWDAFYQPASAKAVLTADGRLVVSNATSDIGTGTYTIMTQIAAEALGLAIENVTFKLGDSSLPRSPLEGGSWTAASSGSAVKEVCDAIAQKLFELAQKLEDTPFAKASFEDVVFDEGKIAVRSNPSEAVSIADVMRRNDVSLLEEETTSLVTFGKQKLKQHAYASNTHAAVFVEVNVDEELGTIHVIRVVSAVAAGRILNPKTARSQILGGVVWGIGMALEEDAIVDQTYGRVMNHNLAEYHVPVNADIHDIQVIFLEEHDELVNPIGVKGVGEIGIVGVAAAIANAVFHATGKRIRELPITLDKLIES
jgi:xanthine dehydrogenase YagR molybdenum-binding subunit